MTGPSTGELRNETLEERNPAFVSGIPRNNCTASLTTVRYTESAPHLGPLVVRRAATHRFSSKFSCMGGRTRVLQLSQVVKLRFRRSVTTALGRKQQLKSAFWLTAYDPKRTLAS